MTYIPLKTINNAIGSPEADNFVLVTDISTDIVFDKTVLVNALLSFGVPASLSDDLITLINKITPLSINYNEAFTDIFLDHSTSFTGNLDLVSTLFATSMQPSITAETFLDPGFTGDTDSGSVYLGGDATNTTKSKPFVVINVVDGITLQIDSTAGMAFGDNLVQGINNTSIVNITDSTHLIVGSTTGWVASTLASTF